MEWNRMDKTSINPFRAKMFKMCMKCYRVVTETVEKCPACGRTKFEPVEIKNAD